MAKNLCNGIHVTDNPRYCMLPWTDGLRTISVVAFIMAYLYEPTCTPLCFRQFSYGNFKMPKFQKELHVLHILHISILSTELIPFLFVMLCSAVFQCMTSVSPCCRVDLHCSFIWCYLTKTTFLRHPQVPWPSHIILITLGQPVLTLDPYCWAPTDTETAPTVKCLVWLDRMFEKRLSNPLYSWMIDWLRF